MNCFVKVTVFVLSAIGIIFLVGGTLVGILSIGLYLGGGVGLLVSGSIIIIAFLTIMGIVACKEGHLE